MQKVLTILTTVLGFILLTHCGNTPGTSSGKSTGTVPDTGKPVIVFKDYEHDFGKVKEGEKIGYIFTFENKGTSDLVVTAANTSCGCTIPKFSKNPVEPGNKGTIEVVFDTSGRSGVQTKTISVHSNAKIPVVILKITADIATK
jgi:hypothetical protein